MASTRSQLQCLRPVGPLHDPATQVVVDPIETMTSEPSSLATIAEKNKPVITFASLLISLALAELVNVTHLRPALRHVVTSYDQPLNFAEGGSFHPVPTVVKHNPLRTLHFMALILSILGIPLFTVCPNELFKSETIKVQYSTPEHGSSPLYLTPSSRCVPSQRLVLSSPIPCGPFAAYGAQTEISDPESVITPLRHLVKLGLSYTPALSNSEMISVLLNTHGLSYKNMIVAFLCCVPPPLDWSSRSKRI